MEEVEKLSCKEELEISDLDNSGTDDHKEVEEQPVKKKRRRREIDMIKLSDDEDEDSDEEIVTKKSRHFSPGPNSPASHREPRTCVLKASQKRRPLSRLLEHLLRNLEKRDPNQFFAWPVNDNFAPNYSKIIKRPMDFCTIKQKIDDNEYRSLNCFINDFKLMCNNAMKYNKPGTVYHKAARRLLHAGLKQLTPQKLRPQGNILTYMYEIPIRELGFDIGKMDVHKVLKRSSPMKSGGSEAEAASEGERAERGECGEGSARGDHVKLQMSLARDKHRKRIAKKAFPRMDRHNKTTLCVVSGPGERGRTLGDLVGKLTHGTGSLHSLREDRRNAARGVRPLQYGAWGSHAPAHDSTFATLTKDESHLLYHTLPAEMGQGNESLLRFAADSPWAAIYDMPAMFPHRSVLPDTAEQQAEPDLHSIHVDVEALRSLSSLGMDMEFLTDLEEDIAASQKDYGIGPELQKAAQLITELHTLQNARLRAPPPAHLSALSGAGAAEQRTAGTLTARLARMTASLPPAAAAPATQPRAALGVTLAHLDTPMLVDEVSEGTEETCSEHESRSSK